LLSKISLLPRTPVTLPQKTVAVSLQKPVCIASEASQIASEAGRVTEIASRVLQVSSCHFGDQYPLAFLQNYCQPNIPVNARNSGQPKRH
jgi:hypothetical protein